MKDGTSGHHEHITGTFREHRPYLVDLAFGMLGDIGAAEDSVQEAFSRLSKAQLDDIEDMRGWLTVVTSRICLDQIRSARARHERPSAPETLEPAASLLSAGPAVDPADRITLDDEVRLALLVVLQQLRPAERVAFVLHDVFRIPFEAVSTTMNRPVTTCRQLAKRARHKVASAHRAHGDATFPEHQEVVKRFIEACSDGNVTGLLELLDPDASGDVDLGPADPRSGRTAHGSRVVAGNLLRYFGAGPALVSHPGMPGNVVLAFVDGRLNALILFTGMRGGRISEIHVLADPAKMALLDAEMAGG